MANNLVRNVFENLNSGLRQLFITDLNAIDTEDVVDERQKWYTLKDSGFNVQIECTGQDFKLLALEKNISSSSSSSSSSFSLAEVINVIWSIRDRIVAETEKCSFCIKVSTLKDFSGTDEDFSSLVVDLVEDLYFSLVNDQTNEHDSYYEYKHVKKPIKRAGSTLEGQSKQLRLGDDLWGTSPVSEDGIMPNQMQRNQTRSFLDSMVDEDEDEDDIAGGYNDDDEEEVDNDEDGLASRKTSRIRRRRRRKRKEGLTDKDDESADEELEGQFIHSGSLVIGRIGSDDLDDEDKEVLAELGVLLEQLRKNKDQRGQIDDKIKEKLLFIGMEKVVETFVSMIDDI